jgi:hypothetical protein
MEHHAATGFAGQLSGVSIKKEFGNDALVVGGTRFAAVTDLALVVHLPGTVLTEALRLGAKPFVSAGAMGRHGWVEIKLAGLDPVQGEAFLVAAHAAALHAHRRTAVKKPSRARRLRPKRPI